VPDHQVQPSPAESCPGWVRRAGERPAGSDALRSAWIQRRPDVSPGYPPLEQTGRRAEFDREHLVPVPPAPIRTGTPTRRATFFLKLQRSILSRPGNVRASGRVSAEPVCYRTGLAGSAYEDHMRGGGREVVAVRIAVLGPVAIGTVVAGCLQTAGRGAVRCGAVRCGSVRFGANHAPDHRNPQRRARHDRVPGPIRTDPSSVDAPCDVVFVAVKGTQLDAVGDWLSVMCAERTVVCVLQHGIEQEANIGALVTSAVLPAVVWFPAEMARRRGVVARYTEIDVAQPSRGANRRRPVRRIRCRH
jgi:hypothetical protein